MCFLDQSRRYFGFGVAFLFILVACSDADPQDQGEGQFSESDARSRSGASEGAQGAQSSAQAATNVYRLLTGVRSNYGSAEDLAAACIDKLQFHEQMTESRVINAREIAVPVSSVIDYSSVVPVKRANKKIIKRSPENGVEFEPEEETYYTEEYEEISGSFEISGICIGTEYILDF